MLYRKSLIKIIVVFLVSCNPKNHQPIIEPNVILQDFMSYWTYHNKYVKLSEEFVALDQYNKKISKDQFINELINNDFLPLKLLSPDSNSLYQLYPISLQQNEKTEIVRTIRQMAKIEYGYFKQEKNRFPSFNFYDMNGINYSFENCKGKVLILKFWFIGCKPCIEEIPALNDFVLKNKNEEIQFLALSPDKKSDLISFLNKTSFDYNVIPEQKIFLKDSLHIQMYPTHILVDKDGLIVKITNKFSDLEPHIYKAIKSY